MGEDAVRANLAPLEEPRRCDEAKKITEAEAPRIVQGRCEELLRLRHFTNMLSPVISCKPRLEENAQTSVFARAGAEIAYADAAKTTTQMVYDRRGRIVNTQTFRSAPSWWTSGGPGSIGAPPGYVLPLGSDAVMQGILESRSVTYDEADNPVLIADGRTPSEWPAGSKPVTKRMTYDDAYRVTRVEYLNPAGATLSTGNPTTDTWVDPFQAEDQNYSPRSPAAPTTTGNPRPMPHAVLPTRIAEERYAFDSLGNIVESHDDLEAFWDRSLGVQAMNGANPYQLQFATNEPFTPPDTRRVPPPIQANQGASRPMDRRDAFEAIPPELRRHHLASQRLSFCSPPGREPRTKHPRFRWPARIQRRWPSN